MFVQELLAVRDAGEAANGAERALLLAGLDPNGTDVPAIEPVGRTTARLLRVHERLAGARLEGTVACPDCECVVEFAIDTEALAGLESAVIDDPEPLTAGGETQAWRPVAYADLAAAAATAGPDEAVDVVLARCAGGPVDAAQREHLAAAMAAADPLTEVDLDLACPECGATVAATVDVASFTWSALEQYADTVMAEVDVLARAYSWSEADILTMPASRRGRFVDMVTGGS